MNAEVRPAKVVRGRLEAAIVDEVVEKGFPGASIEGVCARAGVERDEFDHYFEDLEDGYCQIFEARRNEIVTQHLLPAFASATEWRDQIRAVAYAMFDWVDEDRHRARFIFVESYSAGERSAVIREEGAELMIDLIDQGRNELDDPERLSRTTAAAIAGTIMQQIRIAVERNLEDATTLLPQLMYNVVSPYVGADEARSELTIERPQRIRSQSE